MKKKLISNKSVLKLATLMIVISFICTIPVDSWEFLNSTNYYINADHSSHNISSTVSLTARIVPYTIGNQSTILSKQGCVNLFISNVSRIGLSFVIAKKTYAISGNTTLSINSSYFIVGTYNSSVGAKLYVNGGAETLTGDTTKTGLLDTGVGDFYVTTPREWMKTAGILQPVRLMNGSENLTSWRGTELGTPCLYDNTAIDGYFYLFFTAEGYQGPVGGWAYRDYHRTIGVARSVDLQGPYQILNGDAPIISARQSYGEWDGYHVLGPSVVQNPEYNASLTDQLNLTGSFTIETQIYLKQRINTTGKYPRILSKGKLDVNYNSQEMVWLLFGIDGEIYGGIRSGGTTYYNVGEYNKPRTLALTYFGMSYNKTSGMLYYYLESTEDGWDKSWNCSIGAGASIDDNSFGELTLLNQLYADDHDENIVLCSVRIKNTASNSTGMSNHKTERTFSNTTDSVLVLNFNRTDAILEDESQFHNHGRIQYTDDSYVNQNSTNSSLGPKEAGVNRTIVGGNTGIFYNSAQNQNVSARVYWRPRCKYLMTVEGATDASRIGVAYSNNLVTGWYLYPLEIIDDASSQSQTLSSMWTGHRPEGTADAELHISGGIYYIFYARENLTDGWYTAMRQGTDLFLIGSETEELLFNGTQYTGGMTTDFDYLSAGTCSLVNDIFNSSSWTMAYQGSHDRYDKSNVLRYVNNVGLAESNVLSGPFTKINGSVLTAGPGDYDYYNVENPYIGYRTGLFYIFYESRAEHTDALPGNHYAEISMAKYLRGFEGIIDTIRIYNRILTMDEILNLSGTPPSDDDIILSSFPTVYDSGVVDGRINLNDTGTYWFKIKWINGTIYTPACGTAALNGSRNLSWSSSTFRWEYNTTFSTVGNRTYAVDSISLGEFYDDSNSTSIIWDRIKLLTFYPQHNGTSLLVDIAENFYMTCEFEYDSSPVTSGAFTAIDGPITFPMTYDAIDGRFEGSRMEIIGVTRHFNSIIGTDALYSISDIDMNGKTASMTWIYSPSGGTGNGNTGGSQFGSIKLNLLGEDADIMIYRNSIVVYAKSNMKKETSYVWSGLSSGLYLVKADGISSGVKREQSVIITSNELKEITIDMKTSIAIGFDFTILILIGAICLVILLLRLRK